VAEAGEVVYKTILFEGDGPVCSITLNRPQSLNAFTNEMVEELNDALFEFQADPCFRVAILSGAGRAFSSGADVGKRQVVPLSERTSATGQRPEKTALEEPLTWKPVIAAVHGFVFGAAVEQMQQCDLIVAARETKFEISSVGRGLGGAYHWARLWSAGGGRFANEVVLTGRKFSADEALNNGIVNHVVDGDQLLPFARTLAGQIAANPPLSVACNVRVMRYFPHRMKREAQYYQQALNLHSTRDFQQSANAFLGRKLEAEPAPADGQLEERSSR